MNMKKVKYLKVMVVTTFIFMIMLAACGGNNLKEEGINEFEVATPIGNDDEDGSQNLIQNLEEDGESIDPVVAEYNGKDMNLVPLNIQDYITLDEAIEDVERVYLQKPEKWFDLTNFNSMPATRDNTAILLNNAIYHFNNNAYHINTDKFKERTNKQLEHNRSTASVIIDINSDGVVKDVNIGANYDYIHWVDEKKLRSINLITYLEQGGTQSKRERDILPDVPNLKDHVVRLSGLEYYTAEGPDFTIEGKPYYMNIAYNQSKDFEATYIDGYSAAEQGKLFKTAFNLNNIRYLDHPSLTLHEVYITTSGEENAEESVDTTLRFEYYVDVPGKDGRYLLEFSVSQSSYTESMPLTVELDSYDYYRFQFIENGIDYYFEVGSELGAYYAEIFTKGLR